VLDSYRKELKYYSQVPKMGLQSIEDIGEQPKEIIKLDGVRKLQLRVAQKGIGEL
jgi:hypothetical protein